SARLLSAKALIEAQSGNQDKALETYLIGLKTFKHLGDSPLITSQLVLITCDGLIMVSLQKMPCVGKVSSENYARLISELESHIEPVFLTRFIQGDRCFGLREFQEYYEGKTGCIIQGKKVNVSGFNKFIFCLWKPFFKRDMRANLEMYVKLEKLCSAPYHENINKFKNFKDIEKYLGKGIPKYCIFTKMAVTYLDRLYETITSYKAKVRVCAVGLALKIYKQEHSNYTETLSNLAPYILKETHNDPFTGKNLVYQRTKEGFMLYSFGPNMKDDEGIPRFYGKAKTDVDRKAKKDYDIVWKCEK
ncbi:hypothetical protein KAI19_02645, partial [bacterium]|nr:hypothetical protein [bacterium]